MRVTIEDGVYDLLEVTTEFMFDNGKGCMVQRNDIFFSSWGYAGEFGGARTRASKSGSRGGGSGEKRKG